ncbi:MAG: hypothetical protein LBU94_03175 [Clostridiales bacterium]|nr:hypothetical protein [Clostridiales bacterium]
MGGILKVNGNTLPEGAEVKTKHVYIGGRNRSVTGHLHHDYVARKREITASWPLISESDRISITEIINPGDTTGLTLEYLSHAEDGVINVIKEEVSAGVIIMKDMKMYWKDYAIKFIEL